MADAVRVHVASGEEKSVHRPVFRGGFGKRVKTTWPLASKEGLPPVITEPHEAEDWQLIAHKWRHENAPISPITFLLNGIPTTISNPNPSMMLVEYLRSVGVTSTKIGCGEGGCGACTVVLATDKGLNPVTVNACMHPVCQLAGMSVTTNEGIGSVEAGLHPIQQRLAEESGTQCGYCTPGFVMSMYGLLLANPNPSATDVENAFDGNMCRCTGYRSILNAMQSFAQTSQETKQNQPESLPSQVNQVASHFANDEVQWFTPASLTEVYSLLAQYVSSPIRLVVGNTSTGINSYYPWKPSDSPNVFIDVSRLADLLVIQEETGGWRFGASNTIATVIAQLKAVVAKDSSFKTSFFQAMLKHFSKVASRAVRNVASWAGNLMTARAHNEFPSDLLTVFTACGASLTLSSPSGDRVIPVEQIANISLLPSEIIKSILLPFASAAQTLHTYKIMSRHQLAHPIVNCGVLFSLNLSNQTIVSAKIVYGGVAPGLVFASQTMAYLAGKALSTSTLAQAVKLLQQDCLPPPLPPSPVSAGQVVDPNYRLSVCLSVFYKAYLDCYNTHVTPLPPRFASVIVDYQRDISAGTQTVSPPPPDEAPVGLPIPKLEGKLQCTGQARYTSDAPQSRDALYGCPVRSTVAGAQIKSIDASRALALEGVHSFISAKDVAAINATNDCGPFPGDEEIFCSTQVRAVGQSVGMILAETQAIADRAAELVDVAFTNQQPIVTTLEDSVAKKLFLPDNQYMKNTPPISRGDADKGLAQSDFVVTGSVRLGGQDHFYMETQSCCVTPEEGRHIRVEAATQGPMSSRDALATTLNVPATSVVVSCRRVGGGFGGKLSRNWPLMTACAVAAIKTGRTVRSQLNRKTNMQMLGSRHPVLANYSIGFMKNGMINAFKCDYFMNAGCTYEQSFGCMEMLIYWADSVYYFPNYYIEGKCCFTNTVSNTATRGPGAMQGLTVMEMIMERCARRLGFDPLILRSQNFYQTGQTTPYNQQITDTTLPRIWSDILSSADYKNRATQIEIWNKGNRWRKRGISLVPTKYCMTMDGDYNETVLININTLDGTICVSTSGVELGQGLNTKVAQVIANALSSLGVVLGLISIAINSTDKIGSCADTGGSGTSETCCAAAINACTQVVNAFAPLKQAHPTASWQDLVGFAWKAGVKLVYSGNYRSAPPSTFNYFVWGAACTTVEVDTLTGEVQVLQVDIVYDCGVSLNPAVDIGQVQGGFIMALGWLLTEETIDWADGRRLTAGTWDYHVPSSLDIPIKFNVTFIPNSKNPPGVLSSKAVGEPPMALASSALLAVKKAIYAARAEIGNSDEFDLVAPATVTKVQQCCLPSPSQLVIG